MQLLLVLQLFFSSVKDHQHLNQLEQLIVIMMKIPGLKLEMLSKEERNHLVELHL